MNIALNDAQVASDVSVGVHAQAWCWAPGLDARQAWRQWAAKVHGWMGEHGVTVRDAVVLLPQVALLSHARQAWSDVVGGWIPRFETVGTLLERLPQGSASAAPASTLSITLDAPLDHVLIAAHLAAQPGARRWRAADSAAFEFAVEQVVAVAHAWIKVVLGQVPAEREAWALRTREAAGLGSAVALDVLLDKGGSTGGMEQWLQAQALMLADQAWPVLAQRRDAVFACNAAAWVAVTAGSDVVPGTDSALMLTLLTQAKGRGLPVLWTPAVLDQSAGVPGLEARPALFEASHSAQEAEVAAALILDAVARAREGSTQPDPVALIAQDRVLTRRIRALLAPHERQGLLVMADESGWTLSTTRAAAAVTRMLSAASPQASSDDWLDWLVEGWCDGVPGGLTAVGALEALLRKQGRLNLEGVLDRLDTTHPAAPVLAWAQDTLAPLRALAQGPAFTLAHGLSTLAGALASSGVLTALQADQAGQAVLKALRLSVDDLGDVQVQRTWSWVSAQVTMGFAQWVAWLDQTLEGANFMPAAPSVRPDVVITPLTRAVLRPFEAVVMPGADERQLGRAPTGQWLSGAQMSRLGMGAANEQQASQWGAWAVLACHPRMMALARRLRDGEPVAASPWLGRWLHELGAPAGADAWAPLADPRGSMAVDGRALNRAAAALPSAARPSGPDSLAPQRLSATGYEQLRACPYRYFARSLLGLSSLDELDEGLDASTTGTWLHKVLKRFHDERTPAACATEDTEHWLRVAHLVAAEEGLTSASTKAYLTPWLVTLPALAASYVQWLHATEQQGWLVQDQEKRLEREVVLSEVPAQPAITLFGDLDRIDRQHGAEGLSWRVMDYKTGSLSGLQQKIKAPQEDTQLAFYAALAQAAAPQPTAMTAAYLRLADDGVELLAHRQASESAADLLQRVQADMSAIWLGQPMPALGEGALCDYCEVRGLCRKDHVGAQP